MAYQYEKKKSEKHTTGFCGGKRGALAAWFGDGEGGVTDVGVALLQGQLALLHAGHLVTRRPRPLVVLARWGGSTRSMSIISFKQYRRGNSPNVPKCIIIYP